MSTDKREDILATARAMVQARGYNALSFRDIAAAVGVKSSTVHYYFPTKGDLGAELAKRYTEEARRFLDGLSLKPSDINETMHLYTGAFRAPLLNDNRMCLCGIMIAERDDLPDEVRDEVDGFTDLNVEWLQSLLAVQRPADEPETRHKQSVAIFSAIEGAQLIARGRADVSVFDDTIASYRGCRLLP